MTTKITKISAKKEARNTIEAKLKTILLEVYGEAGLKKAEKKIRKAAKILCSGFEVAKKKVVPKKNVPKKAVPKKVAKKAAVKTPKKKS